MALRQFGILKLGNPLMKRGSSRKSSFFIRFASGVELMVPLNDEAVNGPEALELPRAYVAFNTQQIAGSALLSVAGRAYRAPAAASVMCAGQALSEEYHDLGMDTTLKNLPLGMNCRGSV